MAYYYNGSKGASNNKSKKDNSVCKNTNNKSNELRTVARSANTVGNIAQRSYTEGFKEAERYFNGILKSKGLK